ncbi:MAG: heavy metal translocating P-type ATPase [Blautia sp.]|nr:heavy metal translocating P-type ATPase [Blautia sp.]
MTKEEYSVTGMTCSACSSRVEKCIAKLNGIEKVSVNLLTNSMRVEYDESLLTGQQIVDAVVKAGYGAASKTAHAETARGMKPVEEEQRHMKERLIISFFFLIPLMYISMGHMIGLPMPGFLSGIENGVSFAFTQLLLCIPVILVNRKYYTKGFQTLAHLAPNMDSLIAVGSSASLIYGIFAIYRMSYGLGHGNTELVERYYHDLYFESAAMILTLITLGKFLEARSKGKTGEAIKKLMDLAPKTACVERDGQEVPVPVEQVVTGDVIIVRPGEAIPADGYILEGSAGIDESAITGESIPVQKQAGEKVIAATINKTGYIRIKATGVGEETTFSRIIKLVEEASSSKAPIAKMADRIAGFFVPAVMGIALLTMGVWLLCGADFEFALSCGICVLVISCPCALGLATPVAIMAGTGKGAENGILIKSGEALETAHNIQCVVLDKTGTITEGRPTVTDVVMTDPAIARQELLEIAFGLEEKSEHPLAEAIIAFAKENRVRPALVQSFEAIPGKGVKGTVKGNVYLAGNLRMMEEANISTSGVESVLDHLADDGKTTMLFADDTHVFGIIGVADVIKPTSAEAVRQLKKQGIDVIMLTGDRYRTARAIQRETQIDSVIAEVLPRDKEIEIAKLQEQGKVVAMIGDGINDAPALARADVGIAIGAGTDVAIESADIVLLKNDLQDAVTAIGLSKAVIRNIKQNLFWAFFYNTLGIPVAAGVLYPTLGLKLNPMISAAAMSMSSIFVVTNALRLRNFKAPGTQTKVTGTQPFSSQTEDREQNCDDMTEKKDNTIKAKENTTMITMKINGMMCPHCQAAVKKALEAFPGVTADVNLEEKAAYITGDADKDALVKAVMDAGYEVTAVE